MRVKNNSRLRGSARLARRAAAANATGRTPLLRRPAVRLGAANTIAAAVAGILYGGGGGIAYAQQATQEAAPAPTGQASQSL